MTFCRWNKNGLTPVTIVYVATVALVCGIFCAVILARRLCRSTAARIAVGVILALVFMFLSAALCFFGCLALSGGGK
jgi:uncharacterized protein YacL